VSGIRPKLPEGQRPWSVRIAYLTVEIRTLLQAHVSLVKAVTGKSLVIAKTI
jgi:hypothetical protein